MFSNRGLFSQIPCPYQDACTVPRCLFLHASPQAQAISEVTSTNATAEVEEELEVSDNLRRKRQKVGEDKGKEVAVHTDVSTSSSVPDYVELSDLSEDEVPPKRRKLDSEKGKDAVVPPSRNSVLATTKPAVVREPLDKHASRREGASGTAKPHSSTPKTTTSVLPRNEADQSTTKRNLDTKAPKDFYAPIKKPKKPDESPKEILHPRPITPAPANFVLRVKLLKMLHEQFVRLNLELTKDAAPKDVMLSDQALIKLALNMEEEAAKTQPTIYANVLKNKLLVYKRMSASGWKEERIAALESKNGSSTTNSVSKVAHKTTPAVSVETGLSDYHELLLLRRLHIDFSRIPQEQHCFVVDPPSTEMIDTALKGLKAANYWECCDRCKNRFQVFPGRRESDGALTTGGPCDFHWGKPFWQDLGQGARGRGDRKYSCCGEAVGISAGCVKNEHHVFKISNAPRLATVNQYIRTPENPELERKLGEMEVLRPVCIDGEMAFTVYGLELIRLTATSWPSGSELLDILVRPLGEILDINSRYSGVWPQQLADAKPYTDADPGCGDDLRIVSGPVEARDLLLRLVTPKTPIVGHGLENDFNSIRLIHPTVIDTAMLFPHKAGLPFRLPLKALMLEHLGRHIQLPSHSENAVAPTKSVGEDGEVTVKNGGLVGHDSKEDANAAGDLVRYLLAKEWSKMKLAGWSWRTPRSTPESSKSLSPEPLITPFEQHFVPPPKKATTKPGLLSVDYLEDNSRRDPTIQAPVRGRRIGSGSATVPGGARVETSQEKHNRDRADQRRNDERERRMREAQLKEDSKLEDVDIERLAKSRGTKRSREGRGVVSYGDLDGANDDRDDDEEVEEADL